MDFALSYLAVLSVPIITDETLTPGESFSVNIAIANVSNLWGYLLFLSYDTDVLTATSYSSHPIFFYEEPGEINDVEGYVCICFHMGFGAPEGFTGSLPNLATIEFTVDDYGWSPLDLHDSMLADPFGNPIDHEEVDGYFSNLPLVSTMIKTLIRTVTLWNLHKGTENSLTSKLEGALHLLDIGNENGAVHKLMDFMSQVEALRDKKLTTKQANQLVSEAQRIIDLIKE